MQKLLKMLYDSLLTTEQRDVALNTLASLINQKILSE